VVQVNDPMELVRTVFLTATEAAHA